MSLDPKEIAKKLGARPATRDEIRELIAENHVLCGHLTEIFVKHGWPTTTVTVHYETCSRTWRLRN